MTYFCDYPACLTRGCDKACNSALSPEEQSAEQRRIIAEANRKMRLAETVAEATRKRLAGTIKK